MAYVYNIFVWKSNRNYVLLSYKEIRYFSLESILGYWHTIINSDRFMLLFHARNNQTTASLCRHNQVLGKRIAHLETLDSGIGSEWIWSSISIPMRIVGPWCLVCVVSKCIGNYYLKQQTIGNELLVQKSFVPSPNRIVITHFSVCI